MRAVNSLGDRNSVGITVTPVEKGDHFELRVGSLGVLARVSRESFEEMLRRGHAAIVPDLTFWHPGGMRGPYFRNAGGRIIYRCDVRVDNELVWLVPEQKESKDCLFFYAWDAWVESDLTMTPGNGATQLTQVSDHRWRKHFCVIVMKPGSSLDFVTKREEEVPDTGRSLLHPLRKQQFRTVDVPRGSITLTEDGTTIKY